jgi:hypothetical protein
MLKDSVIMNGPSLKESELSRRNNFLQKRLKTIEKNLRNNLVIKVGKANRKKMIH